MKTRAQSQSGFTLVELMVVVAIIGILASVGIPQFRKYQAKSRQSEAKVMLSSAYSALTTFYSDFSMYATCITDMGYEDPASSHYTMSILGTEIHLGNNTQLGTNGVVSCRDDATSTQFNYPAERIVGAHATYTLGSAVANLRAVVGGLAEPPAWGGAGADNATALQTSPWSVVNSAGANPAGFSIPVGGLIMDGAQGIDVWGINEKRQLNQAQDGTL